MENKKKIGIGIVILFLILFSGIFSYFKITYSYFGENLTGQLGSLRDINYYSNYPSDVSIAPKKEEYVAKVNSDYVVKNNLFDLPSGYEFSHWNTKSDDSGTKYNINDTFKLTEDIDLYAIWKIAPSYGDINLDGVVNMDDSTVLSKSLEENTVLTGVVLSNADVNIDGKIDLVDVDIIKQAVLGTRGYESLLSNKPVLIYDIYEGTINNNGNNNSGGTGTNGNGNSGNGGSSSGTGKPSNNNAGGSSNNGSGNSNVDGDNSSNNNEEEKVPEKDDVIVDNNNTEEEKNNPNNKSYLWIFIGVILLITLRFVILIVKKIINIKKEDNNCDK